MPINTSEVLSLVTQVCEEEKLRVAMKESIKGGFLAGGSTMIGGLLGGPLGLAIGGTIGGLTAAYLSQGKFKSVAAIIQNDLTPGQKERLANSVRIILSDIHPSDALVLSTFLLQPALKEMIIHEVISFFQSQLHLQIID
ncbi:protein C19orf12 homolog isoform X2 [Procambarus clarkii]|uniref:protein C19orf12 homolog isoform X2 n=1 Tax=Procambarus clarkii TaxID=6728 RepID=UPI001E674659|nr:protein C19orf12 homolog isoform X2 [Procambarus clarkii]